MKKKVYQIVSIFALVLFVASCGASKTSDLDISAREKQYFDLKEEDAVAVEVSNDSVEYEIIILEPGFFNWLQSIARPEGYYSQSFLENRNNIMVITWNQRVMQPNLFNPNLYELQINYNPGIDYGYEVNYKLYNYFIYFQRKYGQRLGPFIPRI